MTNKVLWIPGWASTFEIWKEDIQTSFPNMEHLFLSFADLLEPRPVNASDIRNIVCWSMGALRTVQHSNSKDLKNIIYLHPAFDFCNAQSGWNPKIINLMIRKLKKDKQAVLADFAKQMGFIPQKQEEDWIQYATAQSSEELIRGLEILRDEIFYPENVEKAYQEYCFFGKEDYIVKSELQTQLKESHQAMITRVFESNHWPLPETIKQALKKIFDD